ncbi:MAG: hypothetical protein JWL85_289 [Candidatus Saccharibacteria bacterium]|nr:hypothetical protein [Candidatus Saccharibacteria bacterium]
MNLTQYLILLSGILTVAAVVPYIIDIVRGKTKPRVVSWFTWCLLNGIAGFAAFVDGQYPAAIMLGASTFSLMAIVALGWHHGDRKFERFDIVCQVGALIGLTLWLIFNSPAIAVIAAIIIDVIGALPTVKHAWQKPHEETWSLFALSGAGSLCALLVAGNTRITAIAYPIYIVLNSILFVSIIVIRHKYAVKGQPAEVLEF